MDFEINETSLRIISNDNSEYDLPHLWMRDNCPCNDCRVKETQEKRFMLNSVPIDLKPKKVEVNESHIHIVWPDDHETSICFEEIESFKFLLSKISLKSFKKSSKNAPTKGKIGKEL